MGPVSDGVTPQSGAAPSGLRTEICRFKFSASTGTVNAVYERVLTLFMFIFLSILSCSGVKLSVFCDKSTHSKIMFCLMVT